MTFAGKINGVAMYFILNSGNQRKRVFIGVDRDFAAVFGNGTGPVPVILYHSEHRYGDAQFLQQRLNRRYMALAAIQKNQIRQTAKSFAGRFFLFISGKSSGKHFPHTGIIVWSQLGFHLEFAVIFFLRASAFKHHHTANNGAGANIGNIVRFNVCRWRSKA